MPQITLKLTVVLDFLLGSQAILKKFPLVKTLLLAGPSGVGKTMLVHGVCNETGAHLFHLSPKNLNHSYPGKRGATYLLHLVFKVSPYLLHLISKVLSGVWHDVCSVIGLLLSGGRWAATICDLDWRCRENFLQEKNKVQPTGKTQVSPAPLNRCLLVLLSVFSIKALNGFCCPLLATWLWISVFCSSLISGAWRRSCWGLWRLWNQKTVFWWSGRLKDHSMPKSNHSVKCTRRSSWSLNQTTAPDWVLVYLVSIVQ